MSYKQLETGEFLKLTPAQLALLVEGIDWRRTVAPEVIAPPKLL